MEGSLFAPTSVCRYIQRKFGLWNPGHIMYAAQNGAARVHAGDRDWAGWPTLIDGLQGIVKQISIDARAGLTIEQFVTKYAPPSENKTTEYIKLVSEKLGVPPSTFLKDLPYD